ncbi:hypothetical protein AAMO2058_000472400 [Amorphochlora amoebiformis]
MPAVEFNRKSVFGMLKSKHIPTPIEVSEMFESRTLVVAIGASIIGTGLVSFQDLLIQSIGSGDPESSLALSSPQKKEEKRKSIIGGKIEQGKATPLVKALNYLAKP